MQATTFMCPGKARASRTAFTSDFREQVRQALDNVKSVVEAAHLTMEHVVYVQVYLEDMSQYPEVNGVFGEVFPKTPPARAVLGVAKLPDPGIQINAVAVRNLAEKRAVYPPGISRRIQHRRDTDR